MNITTTQNLNCTFGNPWDENKELPTKALVKHTPPKGLEIITPGSNDTTAESVPNSPGVPADVDSEEPMDDEHVGELLKDDKVNNNPENDAENATAEPVDR